MNYIVKKLVIVISALGLLSICFYGGYYSGVKSEKSKNISIEKLDDILGLKNCRDNYGKASRSWDCKANRNGRNKNCALSLTVIDEDLKTGKVFVDDLELKAQYEISGLTQIWKFDDGSRYEVEPNGDAKYLKTTNKKFSSSYSNYTCSAVKT